MSELNNYDGLAAEYARRSFQELKWKPLDQEALRSFARSVSGPVCDLGCGPGQVARFLADCGKRVTGADLSAGMLEQARVLSPDLTFVTADMRKLWFEDHAWDGITAFYALCHIPRVEVVTVLKEIARTIRPEGSLLLAIHLGVGTLRIEHRWGASVKLRSTLFLMEEMLSYLQAAGLTPRSWVERNAYAHESQSRRGYILARKLAIAPAEPKPFGSPLLLAVLSGSLEKVKRGLSAGKPKAASGAQGPPPLTAAAADGYVEIVDLLLRRGVPVQEPWIDGLTAFHLASYLGQLESARRLYRSGARLQAQDSSGNTPIHSAAFGGQVELLRWLIELPEAVQHPNSWGQDPLACARWSGSEEAVRVLEERPP